MENRIDEFILLSDMNRKVIDLRNSLYMNILFSLNMTYCLKEEKSVYSLLNVALLGLERSVALHIGF
jgi:hypothetical protein